MRCGRSAADLPDRLLLLTLIMYSWLMFDQEAGSEPACATHPIHPTGEVLRRNALSRRLLSARRKSAAQVLPSTVAPELALEAPGLVLVSTNDTLQEAPAVRTCEVVVGQQDVGEAAHPAPLAGQ